MKPKPTTKTENRNKRCVSFGWGVDKDIEKQAQKEKRSFSQMVSVLCERGLGAASK